MLIWHEHNTLEGENFILGPSFYQTKTYWLIQIAGSTSIPKLNCLLNSHLRPTTPLHYPQPRHRTHCEVVKTKPNLLALDKQCPLLRQCLWTQHIFSEASPHLLSKRAVHTSKQWLHSPLNWPTPNNESWLSSVAQARHKETEIVQSYCCILHTVGTGTTVHCTKNPKQWNT